MRKRQGGFTLIELVVVIVILGILAAFAIPRFVSLGRQARVATLDGLAGSLRSAAVLAHSVQMANNAAGGTAISMEGNTISMSNGYPDAAGIPNTLNQLSGFSSSTAGTTTTFQLTDAPTPANCTVTYTEAATNGVPTIAVAATNGCG